MKAFESYLKSVYYKSKTINEYCKNVSHFMNWLPPEDQQQIEHIRTATILEYVSHLKQKSLATSTINVRLGSLRKYFDYLISEERIDQNPANKIHIKGALKKVVIDPLDYSDLEVLYGDYVAYLDEKPLREKKQLKANHRKKVMASLLIFQGLHAGELQKLEVNHLNLNQGTIYIPSSYNSQARELKFQPTQIISLYSYLSELPQTQVYLLDCSIKDRLNTIIKELLGLNEKVQTARHIRASVIMHWIKLHGKRQTQYMIGHKWISSTEYYERQDLEALTDQLEKHHPLSGDY